MNYALQIAYDGTQFTGFQKTYGEHSVQAVLQTKLENLLKQTLSLVCAGRTDSGVHAHGQIVGFRADVPMNLERFVAILNQRLPHALVIKAIWPVPDGLHARFSARARHYRYLIRTGSKRDPFVNRYAWEYPYSIDTDLLESAWNSFQGCHDFQAFAKKGSENPNSQIQIWLTDSQMQKGQIVLDVIADRFLYSMVRQMVGTSLDIARGHLPLAHLDAMFNNITTYKGLCAPAQGLFFCRPLYSPEYGLQIDYPEPLSLEQEKKIPPEVLQDAGKWWND